MEEQKQIAKALYTINKLAKKSRDKVQLIKAIRDEINFYYSDCGELRVHTIDNRSLKSIVTMIRKLNRNIEINLIESEELDFTIFRKNLSKLWEIVKIEDEKNRWGYQLADYYEVKNYVLSALIDKFELKPVSYHVFPNCRVRPLYAIGGLTFHGAVDMNKRAKGLKEIKEISARNKLENKMTKRKALSVIKNFLKTENVKIEKDWLDPNQFLFN
jgi:hypothetical protein